MSLMVRAQARDLALSIRHPQGHLDSEVPGRNHFLSRMMAEASGFQAPDGGGDFWHPAPSMMPMSCQLGPPVVVASGPLLELPHSLV